MDFSTYVKQQIKAGDKGPKTRLMRETGLAWSTIMRAHSRLPLSYPSARKLSEATGGLVSVAELCEPTKTPPEAPESSAE